MAEAVYCIDTSALIDLKIYYPLDRFPSMWQRLEQLTRVDRLIAPEQVLEELKPKLGSKGDEIYHWAKAHRRMFKALDPQQTELATAIIAKFPGLIDPNKTIPDADPFVIALAIVTNSREQNKLFEKRTCIVVTHEKQRQGRIPVVCQHYGVDCIRLLELFAREGWEF